jgi:hypothetical protein
MALHIWADFKFSKDVIWLGSCRLLGSFYGEESIVAISLAEGRMGPLGNLECNSVFDDTFALETELRFMRTNSLLTVGPAQPFEDGIVEISATAIYRYLPPASVKVVLHEVPLNYDPWLAVFGDGFPQRLDSQKLASNVLENHYANTWRVAQSMIAAK